MDPQKNRRRIIKTEGLIVAYALSRLNRVILKHRNWKTWTEAFAETGARLGIKASSMNQLRDEFDPFFDNGRKGWTNRDVRPSRQRVLGAFADVSDYALLEIVDGILAGDESLKEAVVRPLARKSQVSNVAEILRTGRAAERVFLDRCDEIIGKPATSLIDQRDSACGYDFSLMSDNATVFEVKGLRQTRGAIRFTDLEWRTALRLGSSYTLVVIGSVFDSPCWKTLVSPTQELSVKSSSTSAIAIHWHASITVD